MASKRNVAVIIAAAGKSSRFGDKAIQGEKSIKKVYKLLGGRAVWLHSVDKFTDHKRVGQVIVVIDPEDAEMFKEKFSAATAMMNVQVVYGGSERYESVQNALAEINDDVEFIAVHDGARPCFTKKLFSRVIEAAEQVGAAIPALEIHGTIKRTDAKGFVRETVPRDELWVAQTPQVFRADLLREAYANLGEAKPTDDSQLIESMGKPVAVVPGNPANLKITTRDDLTLAEQAIKIRPKAVFDFG
jgi:2-C-methyl-D-erythritol 4-phosphate cytidylyltransferase